MGGQHFGGDFDTDIDDDVAIAGTPEWQRWYLTRGVMFMRASTFNYNSIQMSQWKGKRDKGKFGK